MLLTGFDAPVEQVLYLDRKIVAHDLLQAIARVNRTCGSKRCGYVVERVRQELRKAGFWRNKDMRELLTRALKRDLDEAGLASGAAGRELAQQLVALARENHEALVRG